MSSSRRSPRARRRSRREVGRTGARFPGPATPEPAETAAEPEPERQEAAEMPLEPEPDRQEAAEVPQEPEPKEPAAPEPEAAEAEPEAEAVEQAESERQEAAEVPLEPEPERQEAAEVPVEPEPEPEPESEPAPDKPSPDLAAAEEEFDSDDVRSWVRPYVWTGGRTSTSLEFALETMVSAKKSGFAEGEVVRDEHRQVLQLCERPRSVSEIAALLSVPLGAAKALLGVMAEENLLVVHNTGSSGAEGPDLELMERVLRGLRKL